MSPENTRNSRPCELPHVDYDPGDIRADVRLAIKALMVEEGQVFELRGLNVPARYGKPIVVSGYYDDYDALVRDAVELESRVPMGIYTTLNPVSRDLLCWADNRLVESPVHTTGDQHITQLAWLYVDLDPVRPAGISSSHDEIQTAKLRADAVSEYLNATLSTDGPDIFAFSGNGWHLL